MKCLTTDEVYSGLRLTSLPPGSVNVYIRAASSPPDLRRNSSVGSRMGVSRRTYPWPERNSLVRSCSRRSDARELLVCVGHAM